MNINVINRIIIIIIKISLKSLLKYLGGKNAGAASVYIDVMMDHDCNYVNCIFIEKSLSLTKFNINNILIIFILHLKIKLSNSIF